MPLKGSAVSGSSLPVYKLDTAHASVLGAEIDATAYIQGVLDQCAAAGGGVVLIPENSTFFHTLLEVGDYTLLQGQGDSSVLKQLSGITYVNAGTPTGSYGLTCKTGLHWVGFDKFLYDGNASACTDAASNFDTAFVAGVFTPGQLKVSNIAIDRLNRGNLVDGTWVSPDKVYLGTVKSINAVRSNFLFQMATNRATPGRVQAESLHATDSAIDHLLYAAQSETVQIAEFVGEGHWEGGAFAISGAKLGSVAFRNLTANPYNNVTNSYDFESRYVIDDRPDIKNSSIEALSLTGDLNLLGGTDALRCLVRARGFGCTVKNVQIEHTGTSLDMAFTIMLAENGSGGTVEGPSMAGVKAKNMPSKTTIFAFDPSAAGSGLIGGGVSDVYMSIVAGAAAQATALFSFAGTNAAGFTAKDVYVEKADFATGGPHAIYSNACTGSFADITFDHVVIRRASSANPAWVDATATASNVILRGCKTYSSPAPSRAMEGVVERMYSTTIGATKYADSWLTVSTKGSDTSATSNTTLATDAALTAYARANATYLVEVTAFVDADATGAIKTTFTGPSGATLRQATGVPPGPFAAGTVVEVRRSLLLTTGSTANFVNFQWAQNVSSATATTVKTGSYLRLTRIA